MMRDMKRKMIGVLRNIRKVSSVYVLGVKLVRKAASEIGKAADETGLHPKKSHLRAIIYLNEAVYILYNHIHIRSI